MRDCDDCAVEKRLVAGVLIRQTGSRLFPRVFAPAHRAAGAMGEPHLPAPLMNATSKNNFPKIHNAMWPGLVGKGPDSEPAFELDTMLDFTANAQVDGVKFDGVDLFLFDPHVSIDSTDDDL